MKTNVLGANGMAMLGLSGVLGCLALVLRRSAAGPHLVLLAAAALFGTAVGLRAARIDFPLPGALRFAAMASFGSVAFYRSCSWIRQQLH